jgi:hypothetical protein
MLIKGNQNQRNDTKIKLLVIKKKRIVLALLGRISIRAKALEKI